MLCVYLHFLFAFILLKVKSSPNCDSLILYVTRIPEVTSNFRDSLRDSRMPVVISSSGFGYPVCFLVAVSHWSLLLQRNSVSTLVFDWRATNLAMASFPDPKAYARLQVSCCQSPGLITHNLMHLMANYYTSHGPIFLACQAQVLLVATVRPNPAQPGAPKYTDPQCYLYLVTKCPIKAT